MTQHHGAQDGLFHVTTNAKGRSAWCILPGVAQIMIDNLFTTRNLCRARVYAFNILPDHVHVILWPGEGGLSRFMHSFKRNSSKDIRYFLGVDDILIDNRGGIRSSATVGGNDASKIMSLSAAEVRIPPMRTIRADHNYCFTGWQHGFYDERIRDVRQRDAAIHYVQTNAIRHGLVARIADWPWSSVHFAHAIDPLPWWA